MFVDSFTLSDRIGARGLEVSGDSDRTLVVAFGAADLIDRPSTFDPLLAAYPRSTVIGCSTAGEICGTRVSDGSVSVGVARFADSRIRSASADVPAIGESAAAGLALARALAAPDLRAVFVLSDGLHVNGSALVEGVVRGVRPGVVVTGGLAADGDRFRRTWILHDGRLGDRRVAAVGFYGPRFRCGTGSKGGWDPFGPERIVTRADGNVLYELDGRPALSLYRSYLGDRAAGLPATALLFPLAVREPGAPPESAVVRTVLAVDPSAESMTFAGSIAEGACAQLMRSTHDRLIDGAATAASASRLDPPAASLAIAVSCVGRRLVLGERVEAEVEAVSAALPLARHVGFYAYGEISPRATGRCDLHNQTMTLLTVSEA
jgi:hypothetical protein